MENVILKLFLYICQCHKDVLIFPKVCACAGTKWLFSLYYVPLSQCVTLHLMSTLQMTRKLFHIQSPTESIADKPSPFLILRPIHQAGDCSYNLLQSSLSGARREPERRCSHLPVRGSTDFLSFPLVAGTAVLMFLQAAVQW